MTHDITRYTKAKFLNQVGKRTPILARFSTVGGEKGSADAARDPRGFAVKFYTEEGNYDMVGNNTPVFFIRDPTKASPLPYFNPLTLTHTHIYTIRITPLGRRATNPNPQPQPSS